MNSRAALFAGLFASVLATTSCSDDVNKPQTAVTPVGPSSLSDLLTPKLGGNWGGQFTLTGVSGGTGPARAAGSTACVAAAFDKRVGETNDNTLSITQSGSDLTATLVSSTTGLSCEYKGSVGSANTFVLHAEQCTAQPLTILCPVGNPPVLELHSLDLVGSSITASFDEPVNPKSISGVAAHSYNVSGEGTLVASHSFQSLTRR